MKTNKFINYIKKINEEIDKLEEKDYTKELQDISSKTGISIEDLQKQLINGSKVEEEHKDLYTSIKDKIDLSDKDFYTQIAIAHIKEIPNYYDLLEEMESKAKEEQEMDNNEVEDEDKTEPVSEAVKKGKCPEKGCIKRVQNKWRIISNKTGKLWPQKYESKEKAETALKAYQANK